MKMKKLLLTLITPLLLTGCNNQTHANVGILYCSGEANSLYQVNVVKEELEKLGLSTRLMSFSNSSDIATVLRGSIDKVDALYIPTDNQCADNAGIIDSIARAKKKPVFAGEEGICRKAGAITLSISYYNIGVTTGTMAIDVLLGKRNIAEMPIEYDENPVKKYNASICNDLGIVPPEGYIELDADGSGASSLDVEFQNVENRKFTIGISQFVAHEALDSATRGFQDAVKAGLGEDNVTFLVQNAAGQTDMCTSIANDFVTRGVDLIMANATPSLQAVAAKTKTIPVLGTSVTEYGVALGIDDFDGLVGTNVSGTSDLAPLKEQAKMTAEVFASFYNK